MMTPKSELCSTSNSSLFDFLIPIVIGATGHRDLRREDMSILRERIREVLLELGSNYPDTPLILMSPLADGADRLVAEVLLAEVDAGNVTGGLIVPMPLPAAEYEKDFDGESLSEFHSLLQRAETSFELPLVQGCTLESISEAGPSRDRQYEQVGFFIASHCQILVALWDGIVLDRTGGTSQIVKYRLAGLPSSQHSPLDVSETGPVIHLLTPRAQNPAIDGPVGLRRDLVPDRGMQGGSYAEFARRKFDGILRRINEFNSAAAGMNAVMRDEVTKSRDALIPLERQPLLSGAENRMLTLFAVSDCLAIRYSTAVRRALFRLFTIAVFAIISFEIYSGSLPETVFLTLYPLGLGMGYLIYRHSRRRDVQSKQLDYRALAEGLRIQLAWRLAGLEDDVSEHYLRKQDTELDWIRQAIQIANLLTAKCRPLGQQGESFYRERLEDVVRRHWVESQLEYFRRAHARNEEERRQRQLISGAVFGGGVAIAVVLVTLSIFLSDLTSFETSRNWLNVLIAISPAIAAGVAGYAEKMAFGVHSKRYQWMSELFGRAAQVLPPLISQGRLGDARDLLRELGKEALLENGDWVTIHREREIEVPRG